MTTGPRRWYGPDRASAGTLLRLAWPLVLTNAFWMAQMALDRVLLSRTANTAAAGAAMAAALLFWAPLSLLYQTATFVATFVAQYGGAGQPRRAGAVAWQALWFAVLGGLAFLLLIPLAGPLMAAAGHDPALRDLEAVYFQCLCFSALPTLVNGVVGGYFTGRGRGGVVLLLMAVSLGVNAVLGCAWVYGLWGFPEWGIVGAGLATVVATAVSAVLGVALLLGRRQRAECGTGSGWRFDRDLFRRLLRFGLPSGVFGALDTLSFTLFVLFVGRLGKVELTATTVAFTLNMAVYMPALGLAQAVSVRVGHHLGAGDPDAAERVTWTGLWLGVGGTAAAGLVYVLLPGPLVGLFHSPSDPRWPLVAAWVPVLLRFVAVYCLFDCVNLVLSFALRGAGDTRFVGVVALALSWPLMVLPTWLAAERRWDLLWAWAFASGYIMTLALLFLLRFLGGRWRSMRVIETGAPEAESRPHDRSRRPVNWPSAAPSEDQPATLEIDFY
jgi:MATE family multidrug resistance protein